MRWEERLRERRRCTQRHLEWEGEPCCSTWSRRTTAIHLECVRFVITARTPADSPINNEILFVIAILVECEPQRRCQPIAKLECPPADAGRLVRCKVEEAHRVSEDGARPHERSEERLRFRPRDRNLQDKARGAKAVCELGVDGVEGLYLMRSYGQTIGCGAIVRGAAGDDSARSNRHIRNAAGPAVCSMASLLDLARVPGGDGS